MRNSLREGVKIYFSGFIPRCADVCVEILPSHSSFIPHYVSRCCGGLAALRPLVSLSLCEEKSSLSFLRGAAE